MRDYVAFDIKELNGWRQHGPTDHRVAVANELVGAITEDVSTLEHQLIAARRTLEQAKAAKAAATIANVNGKLSYRDVLDPKLLMSATDSCNRAMQAGYAFVIWNHQVLYAKGGAETGLSSEDVE